MRRGLPLVCVLLATGCAATAPSAPAAADTTSLPQVETAGKRARPRPHVAGQAQPLNANPYAERPGAQEPEPEPEPRATTFEAPAGDARKPLPPSKHPELKRPSRVAIVFVRQGEVVHDADALLAFDRELGRGDVRSVLALRQVPSPKAGLTSLSAQAKREGNDLLVVDVRPGPDGAQGEAFVVHTAANDLLALETLRREAPSEETNGEAKDGLLPRIHLALQRLEQ